MKPVREIVIDLETLDTAPSAVILTIGAVAVEITDQGHTVLSRWYRRTEWFYQQDQPGRTQSASTWEWWGKQSDRAIVQAFDQRPRLPLWLALASLNAWLQLHPYPIRGNGSDFDNAILKHAYDQHGMRWPYRRNRCLRSLKGDVTQLHPGVQLPEWPEYLTKHHALHDAEYEAHVLAALLQALANKQEAARPGDFARLFRSADFGQIVAMRAYDDSPEIRAYAQPPLLDTCHAALGFSDDDTGEALADQVFQQLTQQQAESMVNELFNIAAGLTNEEAA